MSEQLNNFPVAAILRKRSAFAWIIFIFVIILLVATTPGIGLTLDEPAYITAAESYLSWFQLLFTNPGRALEP